jgi:hypothetical protein
MRGRLANVPAVPRAGLEQARGRLAQSVGLGRALEVRPAGKPAVVAQDKWGENDRPCKWVPACHRSNINFFPFNNWGLGANRLQLVGQVRSGQVCYSAEV